MSSYSYHDDNCVTLEQFIREGSTITRLRGRFAYDEDNLRFRFLEGLADEREPLFAHYFFFKEVRVNNLLIMRLI